MFEHELVSHSSIRYEVLKDGTVTTVLTVVPVAFVHSRSDIANLATALAEYLAAHQDVDRADVVPRNSQPSPNLAS